MCGRDVDLREGVLYGEIGGVRDVRGEYLDEQLEAMVTENSSDRYENAILLFIA